MPGSGNVLSHMAAGALHMNEDTGEPTCVSLTRARMRMLASWAVSACVSCAPPMIRCYLGPPCVVMQARPENRAPTRGEKRQIGRDPVRAGSA